MVKRTWVFVALIGASACASTVDNKTGAITSVRFVDNGAWTDQISSDETSEFCSGFVLTENDVRDFFKAARTATAREYEHDLDMSRCFASGELILSGKSSLWKIDRARRGRLIFPDKSERYFYCPACKNDKFFEEE